MNSRRRFLTALSGSGLALLNSSVIAETLHSINALSPDRTASEIASDETFWLNIQQGFDVDRSIVNLNNGGVSPAPRVVIDALRQYTEQSNTAPSYTMWRHLEPNVEHVRSGIARMFGVGSDEIAITRNASESLETVQFGLDLKRGDEIITTSQDYPRMITTWEQRVRREGVILKKVDYPVPLLNHEEYLRSIEGAITDRTRVIHVSHVCFMTGQILPVEKVCAMARERKLECIVDGAHAFAQFPFTQSELNCDFYGVSLHKWTCGPIGTGMLYVRRDRIKDVWPLMAAAKEQDDNIRKFEEIGTHPAAIHNALGAAIMFNESLGIDRKAARFRYLHRRWVDRLKKFPNVHFMSDLTNEKNWCGIVVVNVDGTNLDKLQSYLFDKHRIFTVAISHAQFKGLRITPSVYTRASEVDEFADVMEAVARGHVADVLADK